MNKKISVIIPAKNEDLCLSTMVNELPMDIIKEIIVIDGHSTDNTVQVAKDLGLQVYLEEGKGYGCGISTGLKYATGDYITIMDADGSYDPKSLYILQEKLENENLDAVFCSRYLPESGSDDDTPIRFLGNKLFSWALRFVHGVQITDSLFLYCLSKKEVFSQVNIKSEGFDWCVEYPIKVHKQGFKYGEIPSFERPRLDGVSKVNAFTDGLQIAWTMLKLKLTS